MIKYKCMIFYTLISIREGIIPKTNKPLPRTEDKVLVRITLDNSVHIIWKDKPLLVKEIPTMFN